MQACRPTHTNGHRFGALNFTHCLQVIKAFRARGMRTDYVHNVQGEEENNRVFAELDAHEIDVIMQVRMLGEGLNDPYLAVADICSVFGSLTPFLQFAGSVFRMVPVEGDVEAVVVAHAGSNVARLWDDLQLYSEANRVYFEELLPFEDAEIFGDDAVRETVPRPRAEANGSRVIAQGAAALAALEEQNVEPQVLTAMFVQRQQRRQAARERLQEAIPVVARRELGQRGIDPNRMNPSPPDNNLLFVIKRTNVALADVVGRPMGGREAWTLEMLTTAYRDDSTGQIVFDRVKTFFWTANNSVLVVAQYSSDSGTEHRYTHWPRKRFCWFRDEPKSC